MKVLHMQARRWRPGIQSICRLCGCCRNIDHRQSSDVGGVAHAGTVMATRNPEYAKAAAAPFQRLAAEVDSLLPGAGRHPRIAIAATAAASLAGVYYYNRYPLQSQAAIASMLPASGCQLRCTFSSPGV